MRKIPYAMDWTPEVDGVTLFGIPILKFTKKQLAAYIVYLHNQHIKSLEEKNRQIGNIINLRRKRPFIITAGD